MVTDGYTPIKGKCTWWRETMHIDDEYDMSVKPPDKRVTCSCVVEGHAWTFVHAEVPAECPESRPCRYYIKNV